MAQSSDYDYQFVEEPSDDLKCRICLGVARDPQQHGNGGCGKIFCRGCIDEHKKTNDKCPNCRKSLTTFKDERSNRDIQSLQVKCTNCHDGCEWVGELRYLDEHLETCDYVKLPCPNECGLATQFFRNDLQKHLEDECPRREYSCPHCQETGEYRNITDKKHTNICPKMIIECSNAPRCKIMFPRETKRTHLSTCQYQEVTCKYQQLGCEEMPFRKDLQEHESDNNAHLHIATTTVLSLRKQCMLNTQLHRSSMEDKPCFIKIFKMRSFKRNKQINIEFNSFPFYTHPGGYKIAIGIDANGYGDYKGTHVSVWVILMRGEHDDQLEFPFKGTIKFELLNQLEDKNHHCKSYTYDGTEDCSKRVLYGKRSDNAQGVHAFIPHGDLGHNTTKNCQYLKDDCLVFRISVDVPSYKPWLQCTN